MSTQNTFQPTQKAYAQFAGTTRTGNTFLSRRDPTVNDVDYPIGQFWQNTSGMDLWYLNSFTSSGGILQAIWINITSGTLNVSGLTGNTGGEVFPTAGNINTVGDASTITVAGNPGTSTLTASLVPIGNGQLFIGSVGVTPVAANLTAGDGISITNAPGFIAISTTGTTIVNYTQVDHAMSPYTVLGTDQYLGCLATTGSITILLPNAPKVGTTFTIKDSDGGSASNPITVTTVGGVVTIDGATSFFIRNPYAAMNVIFNNVGYEVF